MELKKRFKLKDVMDGAYTIGYFDTMAEVKRAALAYDDDVDGDEWMPELRELNPETGKYKLYTKEWHY